MTIHKFQEGSENVMCDYLLYVGDTYYPCSGNGDLAYTGDTIAELQEIIPQAAHEGIHCHYGWYVIIKHSTMQVVDEGNLNDG